MQRIFGPLSRHVCLSVMMLASSLEQHFAAARDAASDWCLSPLKFPSFNDHFFNVHCLYILSLNFQFFTFRQLNCEYHRFQPQFSLQFSCSQLHFPPSTLQANPKIPLLDVSAISRQFRFVSCNTWLRFAPYGSLRYFAPYGSVRSFEQHRCYIWEVEICFVCCSDWGMPKLMKFLKFDLLWLLSSVYRILVQHVQTGQQCELIFRKRLLVSLKACSLRSLCISVCISDEIKSVCPCLSGNHNSGLLPS